jgi:hypothetical protein
VRKSYRNEEGSWSGNPVDTKSRANEKSLKEIKVNALAKAATDRVTVDLSMKGGSLGVDKEGGKYVSNDTYAKIMQLPLQKLNSNVPDHLAYGIDHAMRSISPPLTAAGSHQTGNLPQNNFFKKKSRNVSPNIYHGKENTNHSPLVSSTQKSGFTSQIKNPREMGQQELITNIINRNILVSENPKSTSKFENPIDFSCFPIDNLETQTFSKNESRKDFNLELPGNFFPLKKYRHDRKT